jgi:Flp pilus assembly CpaE family ATPase
MQEQTWQLLLVEDNPGDARLVREMLKDAKHATFVVHSADTLLAALTALSKERFDVVLLDLSLPDSHGLETLSAMQRNAVGAPIVLLTGQDNERMAVTAVERGAQDYLVKGTLTPDNLVRSLTYAIVRRQTAKESPTENQNAEVIGVLGAKGGVGTTTFACHLAAEIASQTGQATLLIDLDTSTSSASMLTKSRGAYSILDASTNLHRLDLSLWKKMVTTTSDGIDLLQGPGAVRITDHLDGERVRHVLRFARTQYAWIVLELGRMNAVSRMLIDDLKTLFLLSTPDVPSLIETKRVLQLLMDNKHDPKDLRFVVNRAPRTGWSADDLEKALGFEIFGTIDDSTSELQDSYASGKFLDARLAIRRQIRRVAAQTLGNAATMPSPKPGFRFFRFARA